MSVSRTPSRTRTPSSSSSGPAPKAPPSRLVPPSVRPSPSLSNLHIHSHSTESNIPPVPPIPTQSPRLALDSTASSVINLDLNEGILIQDGDVEAEEPEEINVVPLESDIDRSDEDSKKTLRKPVFISEPEGEEMGNVAATFGIMQALISVFLDDKDKLRCINAGRTRITFVLRPPLYYACSSSWGEPESVTRSHLEYLHLQILSIVTAAQLQRIFERRTNFDLRRLLNGAEGFLSSLLDRLEFDLAMSTSSLQCLKLEPSLRKRAAEALIPPSKMKDILYIILVAEGRRLEKEGTLDSIVEASSSRQTQYSVADLGIPGLRHFAYKSRSQVQITAPIFEDPYDSVDEQRRLMTLYQTLHDAIHARSGQEGTLKLQYIRTERECVMGWITQPFELYIALSPRLPKTAAVGAANAVARWVKKEEVRLFLRDAPVF
ncbi:hypothetical protein H0H87_011622 [Tephrocybe sp. NHM501043]|nr:hypothetical protein H0H87_011622 [Tephrocybe sp. NHM501043]